MQRGFKLGSLTETDHMEDISVYRKTHKVVLKKWDCKGMDWIWFRMGTSDGLLRRC